MAYPNNGISVVTAGIHDLNQFESTEQIRHINLGNIFVHEEFDGFLGPHDIGLFAFFAPFVFDARVSAINLPSPNEMHSGLATLHGWGSINDSFYPEFPNILQTVNKTIVPAQTCRTNWNVDPNPVHDNHVCAGQAGVGACDRDTGGSLTQGDEIVGIVSLFPFPCGQADRPSIYVRVSAYIPWILDIIDNF